MTADEGKPLTHDGSTISITVSVELHCAALVRTRAAHGLHFGNTEHDAALPAGTMTEAWSQTVTRSVAGRLRVTSGNAGELGLRQLLAHAGGARHDAERTDRERVCGAA